MAKYTMKQRVIAGALAVSSLVGFGKGAMAGQDMDEIGDLSEKLNGQDDIQMVADGEERTFDSNTIVMDNDTPEPVDFFDAAKAQANEITESLQEYRDQRIDDIQKNTDSAVSYLTSQHGVESGAFSQVNDEGEPFQPGVDDEAYNQYNFDNLDPNMSEKEAMLNAHLASIDLATDADLKHLQAQQDRAAEGQSLEEFKTSLTNQLQEEFALGELEDHLFGNRVGEEASTQGFQDPVIQDAKADMASQFEGASPAQVEDKVTSALDKSAHQVEATLNALNDPNLSQEDRMEMTAEMFGSSEKTGALSQYGMAIDAGIDQVQEFENQLTNEHEPSITLDAPEISKVESSIGTEYNPDADPLPDREDDDFSR